LGELRHQVGESTGHEPNSVHSSGNTMELQDSKSAHTMI
jgi:hypothetical protein